jgi:hypothetical protein
LMGEKMDIEFPLGRPLQPLWFTKQYTVYNVYKDNLFLFWIDNFPFQLN